jgi:hypothetical protein
MGRRIREDFGAGISSSSSQGAGRGLGVTAPIFLGAHLTAAGLGALSGRHPRVIGVGRRFLLLFNIMNQRLTPSDLMRAKRPYLYSDSTRTDAYRLSRSELSHHLDTLTDRNQHKDFENFARRLCEREICPNLRQQTGPEGGGDGKVDTETYPVDEKIAERWFVGNRSDGQGKWGFAFSTKKDWANKVRSDVKGIVEQDRSYEKIFFATSRPTRAKDRLRVEDELRIAYGIIITIFDREWILDRVFSHDHKDLAFEALAAGAHDPNSVHLGPNDFRNQQALTEVEKTLSRMGDTLPDHTQAVSDTYEAATLSRQLERPRYETEGRFQRAIDFAKKYGATYQQLRAIYQFAWTRFWWFDDVEAALELYEQVEEIAFASGHAEHISKVCNLHQLLVGQVLVGLQNPNILKFPERSSRLKAKLVELADDKARPNNALYAEALLWLFKLNEKALEGNRDNFDDIWIGLSSVIDRAAGLGEFPAEMIDSMVELLSPLAHDSEEFDKLVEKLAEFMAERSKELKAAAIYLSQGERKLEAEKPIESIKFLGRSVVNFMKEESREEQGHALYCLATGYRGAGLLWAARGAAMAAIVQVCAQAEQDGEIPVETVPTFTLFTMIALQLGHVLDFLSGIQFLHAALNVLPLDDSSRERLSKKIIEFDQLLSCLFSTAYAEDIRRLTELPDILETMQLFTARMVLLYRLGHLDILKADGSIPEGTADSDIHDMMAMIAAQPASRELPKHIVLLGQETKIDSRVMGINFLVVAEGSRNGLLLAEAHISFIEAFLSTLLNSEAFPHREAVQVEIVIADSSTAADIEYTAAGGKFTVTLPASWGPSEVGNQAELNGHLVEFATHVLANSIILSDHEKVLEQLLGIERAFDRAVLFCRTGMSRNRALGSDVGRIDDWRHLVKKTYAYKADAPEITPEELPGRPADENASVGFGELNSHRDLSVSSIINQQLWDKAGWQGMMYGMTDPGHPPLLGLIFRSAEMADAIFEEWQDRFGRDDANDEIRICIVKGIDSKNPYYYRGSISRDINTIAKYNVKRLVSAARMTTMTVNDHKNLELFQRELAIVGCYFLLPAIFDDDGRPRLLPERAILKRKLSVREAWQIGRHDLDSMAITPEDEVIIPAGQEAPPVLELFKWRREMESRRR